MVRAIMGRKQIAVTLILGKDTGIRRDLSCVTAREPENQARIHEF
jgi:hypothetical protein